jgi:hypothetical protein
MKRVDQSAHFFSRLPRIRLYRGDLSHLIDILTHAELQVTIDDSEFIYDNLDKLRSEKGPEISFLRITGVARGGSGFPRITLTLHSRDDASLSLHGHGAPLEACWFRVRDFFASRRRWHQRVLNPWIAWGSFVLAGPIGLAMSALALLPAPIAYALLYGFAMIYWLAAIFWSRSYPVIVLDRSHEHQSFWRRNGDKIILLILGAAIGAAVTFLTQWLADR